MSSAAIVETADLARMLQVLWTLISLEQPEEARHLAEMNDSWSGSRYLERGLSWYSDAYSVPAHLSWKEMRLVDCCIAGSNSESDD